MLWAFPSLAAAVAGALAVRCAVAARGPGSGALRIWAFALVQYAVASAALAAGAGAGWSPGIYRLYYLFGAVLNVMWLGLGTVWLLAPRLIAAALGVVVAAVSVVATYVTLTSPLVSGAARALRTQALPIGMEVMPPAARAFAQWLSIAGSAIVLAGFGWSIATDLTRRDSRGRRSSGLGLLAAGVVVVVVSSRFARAGLVVPFSIGLASGVSLMYAGFVRSR